MGAKQTNRGLSGYRLNYALYPAYVNIVAPAVWKVSIQARVLLFNRSWAAGFDDLVVLGVKV
jgi:hypothetical protein